ncbi:MAG: substrate-binding domain-containing protein [Pseudomonadota bacterium]
MAVLALLLVGTPPVHAQDGRDFIEIVGSSTVFPFSTVVAERFGRRSDFRTPTVEATGSGGGFKQFCGGIGVTHPDIINASRRVKASELALCASNGVRDVVEVKVGYDGIVLANATGQQPFTLTLRQIWLALAEQVPDPDGTEHLVKNPYVFWSDIAPELPSARIEVFGPPPTSGTRDAFVELAMAGGCMSFDWVAAIEREDPVRFKSICQTVREDGQFIEAGENDNLIVQKLRANPAALGIFGFSFLDQNASNVQGASVGGFAPTFDNIAAGNYPVSRPLYFYVKRAHVDVIPGLREFLAEFTSHRASGADGYLADRGLVPLPINERAEVLASVLALSPLRL